MMIHHKIVPSAYRIFASVLVLAGVETARFEGAEPKASSVSEIQIAERVRKLGGYAFEDPESGRVVEVNLNRNPHVADSDLEGFSALSKLTDLSLEGTRVGDAGMLFLKDLHELEWLNVYQTQMGDEGLRHISGLKRLKHLPVGGTRITDAGLAYLKKLENLQYLGLRDTSITDRGLENLTGMTNLVGLHLGGTAVTSEGLRHLTPLVKLERLWLDQTVVGDECLPVLLSFQMLRELHIAGTRLTGEGILKLRRDLVACRIIDRQE
ncbi:MAG: hypothetical protein O2960_17515 [Verrucomicrobia bacterium]|nr:hypothetical protein [Verrucomicrobiota bacterium]